MLMLSNLVFRLMSNFDFCRHPVKNPVSLERLLRSVDILDKICERNFEKKSEEIHLKTYENSGFAIFQDDENNSFRRFFREYVLTHDTYRNPNLIFESNSRRFLLRQSAKFFIVVNFCVKFDSSLLV